MAIFLTTRITYHPQLSGVRARNARRMALFIAYRCSVSFLPLLFFFEEHIRSRERRGVCRNVAIQIARLPTGDVTPHNRNRRIDNAGITRASSRKLSSPFTSACRRLYVALRFMLMRRDLVEPDSGRALRADPLRRGAKVKQVRRRLGARMRLADAASGKRPGTNVSGRVRKNARDTTTQGYEKNIYMYIRCK